MLRKLLVAVPLAAAMASPATAGPSDDPAAVLQELIGSTSSFYLTQSEQNLMMMPDNPALWTVEEGEALFHAPRGPNNVSLEGCDFGKGPGVLEGAYVELPRYFEDTGKVMDLGNRLIYCMKTFRASRRRPSGQGDPRIRAPTT
jgi:L-cysteine S-thiosulfotransferase